MSGRKRLNLIDAYRGITIISMIGFHACWIFSYFGLWISVDSINSRPFYIWERTICCSFIFISGFVFSFGKHHLKNGLTELILGIIITFLSVIFLYDLRDIFGILWLIGSSTLITILLDKYVYKRGDIKRVSSIICALFFLILLIISWNINRGYLGIDSLYSIVLPQSLYKGYFMTYLGFLDPSFYSVDYFSLFPWVFLYQVGYFVEKIIRNTLFERKILTKRMPFLGFLGRHSLLIYLIHPVVIYIVAYLISYIKLV